MASELTAIILGAEDLPLCCPTEKTPLWCQHPRVYLEFDHHGLARCPYCSTEYRLAEGVKAPSAH